MKKSFYLLLIFLSLTMHSQNTVGTIINEETAFNGFTLLAPLTSTKTYLINNCGEVLNQWSSNFFPGNSVYLLENGNLLRAGRAPNPSINFGGVGGKIQLFDWDGNLLWDYTHSSSTFVQHHDIYPMPNGNILILSAEIISALDAVAAGRNPNLSIDAEVYNERILELEPVGIDQANVVWDWNVKDHLIQDFDPTKNNFGNVGDNPQRLDFNYVNSTAPSANWLHVNSIQFNQTLDQIVISSRILSEFYIIDHSTSIQEAASSSGGIYGKGGDFLYRWGNPEAYRHGTDADRQLFGQHYPHFIPLGLVDSGKILLFNNNLTTLVSSVAIINLPTISPGVYSYDEINGYGPANAEWEYSSTAEINFHSPILSSGQRLPNGNTLICDGNSGHFYEVDTNNTLVWEYVNPDTSNGIISQGGEATQNTVFRALKFSPNYPAFTGRDLTPGNPIELNPDLSNCEILGVEEIKLFDISIYPNPTHGKILIESKDKVEKIEIYSIIGSKVSEFKNSNILDLTTYDSGIYLLKIYYSNFSIIKKVLKE